jgi:hypothetical protein
MEHCDESFGVPICGFPLFEPSMAGLISHGSLDGSEYRSLLAENGFQVVSRLDEDPTDGGHVVWLAQFA